MLSIKAEVHNRELQPHCIAFEPVLKYIFDFARSVESQERLNLDGAASSSHYNTIFGIATASGANQQFPGGSKWCWIEYQHLISNYLKTFVVPKLLSSRKISPEAFLQQYVSSWGTFQTVLSLILFIFSYLDQYQLKETPFTLSNRAYQIWASELFNPEKPDQDVAKWYSEKQTTKVFSITTTTSTIATRQNNVLIQHNPYKPAGPLYTYPKHPLISPVENDPDEKNIEEIKYDLQSSFQPILNEAFLNLSERERGGSQGDYSVLRAYTQSIIDLGRLSSFDQTNFATSLSHYSALQAAYLDLIKRHYSAGADLRDLSFKEYTSKITQIYLFERHRVENFLHPSTLPEVEGLLHALTLRETLAAHLNKENSMDFYLSETNISDTAALFQLIGPHSETTVPFAEKLKSHVIKIGTQLIEDFTTKLTTFEEAKKNKQPITSPRPSPLLLIQSIIEQDSLIRRILKNATRNNSILLNALREATESFLNHNGGDSAIALHLANFTHSLLSTRSSIQSTNFAKYREDIPHIFKYLRNRDVFEQEYQRLLCQRLLSGDSIGSNSEQEVLTSLIVESGSEFSRKATAMQTDIDIANRLTTTFNQDRAEFLANNRVQVNFNVCTTNGGWVLPPSRYQVRYSISTGLTHADPQSLSDRKTTQNQTTTTAVVNTPTAAATGTAGIKNDFNKLPLIMQQIWQQFGQFYCSQHERRYLEFYLDEGICDLSLIPDPTKPHIVKTIVCTPIMAVILLHLGKQTKFVTWKDLCHSLSIDPSLLSEHLLPLCLPLDDPTKALVRKSTPNPAFGNDEKIILSKNFVSSSTKVYVRYERKLTKVEQQQQSSELTKLRLLGIKGVIVRWLKMKKTSDFNELFTQVRQQLSSRFEPTSALVKEAIESAITDSLIERSADNKNVYEYAA
jgi:hypothetical protein